MQSQTMRKCAAAVLVAGLFTLAACGGGGDTGGDLVTDAPKHMTIEAGSSASYSLKGAFPAYKASTGDANIATAKVNGQTLWISAVAPGNTSLTIEDSLGYSWTFEVTVAGQVGTSTNSISVFPSDLTLGNCTTRVPFLFSGGSGSYSVFTSNNFYAPVTSALPLGDGRYYFFLDLKYPPMPDKEQPALLTTLSVLDNQGVKATAKITTHVQTAECPTFENAPFSVYPESANFRTSEIRGFQVSAPPDEITFSDPDRFIVISRTDTEIRVQALSTTQTSTLMTVRAGQQRGSVVLQVLPQ